MAGTQLRKTPWKDIKEWINVLNRLIIINKQVLNVFGYLLVGVFVSDGSQFVVRRR